MIEGVDHNFQVSPVDEDARFRERYSFESFKRPYSEQLYVTILDWLKKAHLGNPTQIGTLSKTEPSRPGIVAWNGIQIIEDITDAETHPGIETLEGRIGPLMKGEKSQAHYIDMPAGLFLAEHPHSSESIIFCVRGRFVLCSGGRRQLMKPGSLMWFGANEPTGWEVPYDEPAYILIFKGSRSERSDDEFRDYLRGLAEKLKKEQADGAPYHFRDLPFDHPAREFARKVNADFDSKLPKSVSPRRQ
jgi:quercetin dioxygenase-like cupin family protein